jgi:hypothetical protein
VVQGEGFSRTVAGKLLAHCFIAMFFGFVGGFVWLIALADNVFHILPLPRLEISVPDQKELLRNAHTGAMMNAMYVMAMVVMSRWLDFSATQAKFVYYFAIIMLWGNLIGYSAAVYTPYRGIQPIFTADIPNLIAYFTFYAAVIGAVVTTGICLNNAIRSAHSA